MLGHRPAQSSLGTSSPNCLAPKTAPMSLKMSYIECSSAGAAATGQLLASDRLTEKRCSVVSITLGRGKPG